MQPSTNRVTNVLLAIIAVALVGIFIRLGDSASPSTIALKTNGSAVAVGQGRYQLQRVNENNVFLVDTQTGKVWRQFVESNSGPTEWMGTDPTRTAIVSEPTSMPSDAGTAVLQR